MRKIEAQSEISCHQMKLPVPGLAYIQLNCWPKTSHPQTTESVAKTMGCSPQTNSKNLLLQVTAVQLIDYGEVKGVPT